MQMCVSAVSATRLETHGLAPSPSASRFSREEDAHAAMVSCAAPESHAQTIDLELGFSSALSRKPGSKGRFLPRVVCSRQDGRSSG